MPDGSVSLSFGKEGATVGFGAGYYYVTLSRHHAKNVSWDYEPSGQEGLAKVSP